MRQRFREIGNLPICRVVEQHEVPLGGDLAQLAHQVGDAVFQHPPIRRQVDLSSCPLVWQQFGAHESFAVPEHLAVPPDRTSWVAPLETFVPLALPPLRVCVAEKLRNVAALAVPPEKTTC